MSPEHNSTHLLDIQSWEAGFLISPSGKPMLVNIFDFGGQDYYHDAHRMYYSHDTAYILLWDTSTNRYSEETEKTNDPDNVLVYENYPLEYWLESINYNLADKFRYAYRQDRREDGKTQNAGNSAPVLVLQNKIDIEEGRLDQKKLSDKYQNISGFFNLSLKYPKRTSILFEIMSDYIGALDLSGRQLISYEHDIIENYLNHPRAFKVITLDEFYQECLTIINNASIPFTKENAQIIAEILNAIGIIFYDKQSATEGIIFTQIRRLNELIKEVMDVAKKGNDKGIFNITQVQHIEAKDHILQLLTKNNSIIRISDGEFLVPQFLPVKPDPSVAFFLFAFTYYQVRFIYKAYFHKSVLLSLFAKYLKDTLTGINTSVKNLPFWRNGIIISRDEGNKRQMVLVEFEKTDAEGIIKIKTMAPYNKTGLERDIEKTLDELNKGWTVSKEISVNGVDFFDVKMLREEVKALRYEFPKNGKLFTVNDFKHITDFEKLPKKLFISYSSKNAEFIRRFVTHLEVLKAAGAIDPWYDRMIESGTKWDDTIREEMRSSDVVIFLLSPDFLATEYIMKTEIPLAIEQMKAERSKFFFIELQPCGWKRTVIANYQQTDDPNEADKNIIRVGEPDNDAKWNIVIDELEKKMNA
jgi:internalin A